MTQACSTITIRAPADAVWQLIGRFDAAQDLSGVVRCTVEGEGVGAVRRLTSADGTTVVEHAGWSD